MSPFKNDAEELADGSEDAANVDPKFDYEPPDSEAQSGPDEGANPAG